MIENIIPDGYVMKGVYTPAKKIDLGDKYLIFVSGVQAPAGDVNEVCTEDIGEQTELVFQEMFVNEVFTTSLISCHCAGLELLFVLPYADIFNW